MNTQTPEPRISDHAPIRLVYPTDIVGKALTYSLNEPVEPQRQNIFADAIGQQGVEAGWWIAALCMLMLALINLIIGWYTEDSLNWSWYWSLAIDALLAQVFILWGIWYTHREARVRPYGVKSPTQISIRSLRRAALAGDDHLAPPVTDLIEMPAAPPPNATLSAVTVLPPEWRLLRRLKIGIGICVGICVLPGVAQLVRYAGGGTLSLALLGFVLPSLILCLWQFVPIVRKSRSFRVDACADGLYWQKHALPWSEVRGWFVFSLQLQNTRWTHPNTIYALVGQHASLTWLTYPPEIESQDPGKRLAELVQAHVGLPLRDLTPGAICISEDIGGRLFANTSRLLAVNNRYILRGALPRLAAAIMTFALSALILLAGILTPYGQRWYFGRQLMQLETARSAVRDPLTTNMLQWAPAAGYYVNTAKSFAFTSNGYVVSGDTCCDLSSLIAQSVSNGLVEVTVRQQSSDGLSDAGVVFRANSSTHTALAFTFDLGGYWQLSRYSIGADGALTDEQYLLSGLSPQWMRQLIHQGHDATNRLAVLMQGSAYTFFINGQYVGRYSLNDPPQSGQVGVYVEGTGGPTTFSDLLISPT